MSTFSPARATRGPRGRLAIAGLLLAALTVAATGTTDRDDCGGPSAQVPSAAAASATEDGIVHLGDGTERERGFLYLDSQDPADSTHATGSWRDDWPSNERTPGDPGTLAFANNADLPEPDFTNPRFSGEFTGRLHVMELHVYQGHFIEQVPQQPELQISISVDDRLLYSSRTPVFALKGRPDVCHASHHGSYFVQFSDFEPAMTAQGIEVGPDTHHTLEFTLAPVGNGQDAPPFEVFAVDTSITPSRLTFNPKNPYEPVVSLAPET